jgi:Lipocalin-like domain
MKELAGTYSLISSTRKIVDTGEVLDTWGKNPNGFITYGKDGRLDGHDGSQSREKRGRHTGLHPICRTIRQRWEDERGNASVGEGEADLSVLWRAPEGETPQTPTPGPPKRKPRA